MAHSLDNSTPRSLTDNLPDPQPRAIVKNSQCGFYYAAPGRWVTEPESAFDFRTAESAAQWVVAQQLAQAAVLLRYEELHCELTLPVRPEWV